MKFKRYLVPVLAVGSAALGMSEMASATIATVALPTDVSTELGKVGFSGLSAWTIGIIALVASVSAGFAIARIVKRGAAHV